MRVFLRFSVSEDAIPFKIEPGDTVKILRGKVQDLLRSMGALSGTVKPFLVWGGNVITNEEDNVCIAVKQIEAGAVIQAVLPSTSFLDKPADAAKWLPKIFNLSGEYPLVCEQDDTSHLELLSAFCTWAVTDEAAHMWAPDETGLEKLCKALQEVQSNKPEYLQSRHVQFFGAYGCVLVSSIVNANDRVKLKLICLDKWEFQVHCGQSGEGTFTSTPSQTEIVHVGSIDLSEYESFLSNANTRLNNAQHLRRDQRSAAFNTQGHQKTPAFIQAIMKDAIADIQSPAGPKTVHSQTPPRGGFTDVGLHTGGKQRNTTWPLIQAVLQHLVGEPFFCQESICQLQLRMIECVVSLLRDDGSTFTEKKANMLLSGAMQGLQESVVQCAQHWLYFEDKSLQYFKARTLRLRYEMQQVHCRRSEALAEKFELPPLTKEQIPTKLIELRLPNVERMRLQDYSIEAARMLALENLQLLQLPYCFEHLELRSEIINIASLEFKSVFEWIGNPHVQSRASDIESTFLICRIVETFFFRKVLSLTSVENDLSVGDLADECKRIEQIIDEYRQVLSKMYMDESKRFRLLVELRSREFLVVWAGFCLIHRLVSSHHPILLKYRPALDPDDLQYLVLGDKLANNALRHVSAYLQHHAAARRGFAFSLRSNDKTFELAREYAREHLLDELHTEQQASDKRKQVHWDKVRAKKDELSRLDKKLRSLEQDLWDWKRKYDQTEPPRYDRYNPTTSENDRRHSEAESKISSLKSQISRVKTSICNVERPPQPILQPLPRNKETALPILFFLQMPVEFQVLSRFSCLSQQMLLPSKKISSIQICTPTGSQQFNISEIIATQPPATVWRDYYLSASSGRAFGAVQPTAILGSEHSMPNHKWHPDNVRMYTSEETGVWYPDQLTPKLYWGGQNSGLDQRSETYFNPFTCPPHEALVCSFTEQVTNQNMQWAFEQHGKGTSSSRGNWAEAALDLNHGSLVFDGKYEYLSFCALRAHPYQQVRKLCVALKEKTIPLMDNIVRVIILQMLYHIGPLDLDSGAPLWQVDLHSDLMFGGWHAMHDELEYLADEIEGKTREHGSLLTLGLVSAYAAQRDENCRDVSRKFARIARKWADDLARGMKTAQPKNIPILRARACMFYLYSIMCYGGDLSQQDVADLCELSLLAESYRIFEEETNLDDEVKALNLLARDFLSKKMESLLQKVQPQMLTDAVNETFEGQEYRSWRRVKTRTGVIASTCYEAITGSGHLLSVNVLTGTLLYDGLPPQRLPASITATDLYRRTFTDHNFDVIKKDSALETARLVNGRTYSFCDHNGKVVVHERDSATSMVLELLDGTRSGVDGWSRRLPLRLARMHSHWLDREGGIIFLRRPHFDNYEVHFIMVRNGPVSDTLEDSDLWKCYRVPSQRRKEPWLGLFEHRTHFDELMPIDPATSCAVFILQKFEDKRFIHCYRRGEGKLVLEFPRYGLEFELEPDGKLHSKTFGGFFLCKDQKFLDTLHGFEQYLILKAGDAYNQSKVLIPSGNVVNKDGNTYVSVAKDCSAHLEYHVYEIHHRFNTINPLAGKQAIEARLQLACLHAASPSCLPELTSQQTGCERAIELVRQCFVNRPLSENEHGHLRYLFEKSNATPALSLLSTYLDSSSRELSFLHPIALQPPLMQNDIAATRYTNLKRKGLLSSKSQLTNEEEEQVLGETVAQWRPSFRELQDDSKHKRKSPFSGHSMDRTEVKQRWRSAYGGVQHFRDGAQKPSQPKTTFSNSLGDTSRSTQQSIRVDLELMLKPGETNHFGKEVPFDPSEIGRVSKIASETFEQLIKSWEMHRKDHAPHLGLGIEHLSASLVGLHEKCKLARRAVETEMMQYICYIPSNKSLVALDFAMRRAASLEPVATVCSLVAAAGSTCLLRMLNPCLSAGCAEYLHGEILQFLCLCVLEDKLERMIMLASKDDAFELKRELVNIERAWDVAIFPSWLAFEVEQRIQIRNIQYRVAKFCCDNPSKITQLNMGEGKTRVILPMLLLELARPDRLVRMHFLSSLLSEAFEYLHCTLTAGIFNRKLFMLPFHRSVNLGVHEARAINQTLHRCQRGLGAVCVAPEHRLSLHLKGIDGSMNADVQELHGKIEVFPYFDIFDESDEILHHKYQLIYAVGSCIPLPQGDHRIVAVQSVLNEVQNNPSVVSILNQPGVATRSPSSGGGTFDMTTLHQGKNLDRVRVDLLEAIASGIVRNPPYHMRWVRDHDCRDKIIEFVCRQDRSLEWLQANHPALERGHLEQLTALRGLLACRVLEHCLCRRFRVDYGIDPRRNDPSKGLERRIAVPYRACDCPAERAEYAHSDTIIVLTQLSYYYQGLSLSETGELVNALLKCGPESQKKEYDTWLSLGISAVPAMEQRSLDDVKKLDPTNQLQMFSLHRTFRYNMAAVNFWLSRCVFPRETMQFPQRLIGNACHLADNRLGTTIGFSGTKDNHLLLPPQVEQSIPEVQALVATDGKMMNLILQNQEVVFLRSNQTQVDVLKLAVTSGIHAIIDAGAIMAGLSGKDVANHLLDLLVAHNSSFKGVVYFDMDADIWVVKGKDGRSWHRGSSPITEAEALVYYDERRCRGSDMKLPSSASAYISVSIGMTKDKLMQAAGRMRKLDRGQTVKFLLPPAVVHKINDDLGASSDSLLGRLVGLKNVVSTKKMLLWILKNTIDSIALAMPEWASQASYFATTEDNRTRTVDEILSVEELYGGAVGGGNVNSFVREMIQGDIDRVSKLDVKIGDENRAILEKVQARADKFGSDQFVVTSANNEECERELEVERELEREVEREIARILPQQAVCWDVSTLLEAKSPKQVTKSAKITELAAAMQQRHRKLSGIEWNMCGSIFITGNFIETVLSQERYNVKDLSDYMRPVDVVVLFGGTSPRQKEVSACLLVSEWEADQLLPLLVSGSLSPNCSVSMANLAYLKQAADAGWDIPCKLHVPERFNRRRLSEEMMAGLQLLAGDTTFATRDRKEALRNLLTTHEARTAAKDLLAFRGRSNFLDRSDLEEVCALDMLG